MKKQISLFLVSLIFSFLISGCGNVGLGSAVDTQPPKIGVSYPADSAVIRDWFYIAGSCSDDQKVSKIHISIVNNENEEDVHEYTTEPLENGLNWQVKIQKEDLVDGKYSAKIKSIDAQEKESSVTSVSFIVDNTPPVLLLSRPLKKGTEKPTVYGRTLKLAGDISDENDVENLVVRIKPFNQENGTLGQEILPDISDFTALSADNPYIIARYYTEQQMAKADESQKQEMERLTKNYHSIYGEYNGEERGQDKVFYLGIEMIDNARLWQDTSIPNGTGEGNLSTQFFLNTDEFSESVLLKYNLTIVKIRRLISGKELEYSPETREEILKLLKNEQFISPSAELDINTSAKFALNPENNPYWSVNGYIIGQDEQGNDLNEHAKYNGYRDLTLDSSQFVVTLNAGNDNIKVAPSTVEVYLKHAEQKYASKPPVCILKKGEWDDESDTSLSKAFMASSEGFFAGELIDILVSGEDVEGNPLLSSNPQGYGFKVTSNNLPPEIQFIDSSSAEQEDVFEDRCFNANDIQGKGLSGKKIRIRGTVTTDAVSLKRITEEPDSPYEISAVLESVFNTNNLKESLVSNPSKFPLKISAQQAKDSSSKFDFSGELELSEEQYNSIFEKEGRYKLKVKVTAIDEVNNSASGRIAFYLDNMNPKVAITSVEEVINEKDSVKIIKGAVTVKARITDNSVVDKIYYKLFEDETEKLSYQFENAAENISFVVDSEKLGFVSGKKYSLVIYGVDEAGNMGQIQQKFCIDKEKPSILRITDRQAPDALINETNWFNSLSQWYILEAQDELSGIESVEWALSGEKRNWVPLTKTKDETGSVIWKGNVTLAGEGASSFSFKATDGSGNVLETDMLTSFADTTNPVSMTVESVNSNSNNTGDTQYVNPANGQVLSFVIKTRDFSSDSAEDKLKSSGIASVTVKGSGEAGERICVNDDGSENWKITLNPEKYATGMLYVNVADRTGNCQTFSAFNVELDNVAPVVSIDAIGDSGKRVNGLYTLSGTVSEDKVPLNVAVYYYVGEQVPQDLSGCTLLKLFSTESGTDDSSHSYNLSNSGIFNWRIENVSVESLAGVTTSETKKLTFFAIARDKALNSSGTLLSSTKYTYTVDLDSDRPEITFQNLDLNKEDGNIWLKQVDVFGYISDDDGSLKDFKVYYSSYNPEATVQAGNTPVVDSWTEASVIMSGSSWSFKMPSQDGPYQLKFYVKDAEDKEFTSRYIQEVKNDDSLRMYTPKITGSKTGGVAAKTLGTSSDKETIVCFRLNTTPPTMDESDLWISIYNQETAQWSKWFTTGESGSQTIGGRFSKIKIKARATDKNSVTGIDVSFSEKGSVWDDRAAVFKEKDGEGYSVYVTDEIDCKTPAGESGTVTVTVTAKNKGQSRSQSMKILIDNEAPVLTVTNPSKDVECAGTSAVTASGSTGLDIGLDLKYGLSLSESKEPDLWTSLSTTGTQWVLYFDGNDSDPSGVHGQKLNSILSALTGKSETDLKAEAEIEGKTYSLFLWIKGKDAVGNETVSAPWEITVNPNGGKPVINISYPEMKSTVGGIVGVYGSASASDEKTINSVWIQLSGQYHKFTLDSTDWDSPAFNYGFNNIAGVEKDGAGDVKIESLNPSLYKVTASDLDYLMTAGYEIYKLPGVGQAFDKDSGQFWLDATAEERLEPENYAIYVEPKGLSWSLNINKNQEFNFAGHSNGTIIKVFAVDSEGSVSDSVFTTACFTADTPSFSNLTLVQSSDVSLDSPETAARTYTEGMYVKGSWFLKGTLSVDNGTLTSFTASGDRISGLAINCDSIFDGRWVQDKEGKELEFKIKLDTENGVGTFAPELYASTETNYHASKTIVVNYDNKAPVLVQKGDDGYNIKDKIQQSNNAFTFGSAVHEDSENGTSQSGFERVAFYFKRTIDSDSYVYDVMLGREASGNKTSSSALRKEFGLYWKELNVRVDSSSSVILKSGSDLNVRTGGLMLINGTIYRMKNVSGTTVSVDGNIPSSLIGKDCTGAFAVAQVVDNSVTETGVGSLVYNNAGVNGVYSGFVNEDGDKMIESTSTLGTVTTWEASVYSANIPDGPIEICYVVFDKAGNWTQAEAKSKIVNFQPRIAGLRLVTDFTGNGIPETEIKPAGKAGSFAAESYSGSYKNPDGTYVINSLGTSLEVGSEENPFTTVKGVTKVIPEVVGGSGRLYYSYNIQGKKTTLTGNNESVSIGSGKTDYTLNDQMEIALQVGDLIKLGDSAVTLFDFTIWDSMEAATVFQDTSSAKLKIYLGIGITDSVSPEVQINPVKAQDYVSVYDEENEKTVKYGHIEASDGLPSALFSAGSGLFDKDPKVSGQIILNGTARDNKLLSSIFVQIIKSGSDEVVKVADYSTGNWVCTDYYEEKGFKLETENDQINETGHSVNWKLYWNTAKITGFANSDVIVKVFAKDQGQPYVSESSQNSGDYTLRSLDGITWYSGTISYTNEHSSEIQEQRVDVVPYITGLETILGNYNENLQRSALGKYSVNKEEKISVNGFNFGSAPQLLLLENEKAPGQEIILSYDQANSTESKLSGVDISGVSSGMLSLKVNEFSTLNNINNNGESTNLEPNPYINTNLNDDIELAVWEFKIVGQKQSSNLENPVLKISPNNGAIGASFTNMNFFNMAGINYDGSKVGWYTQTPFNIGSGGLSTGTFSFDKNGVTYGAYQFMTSDLAAKGGYFDLSIGRARRAISSSGNTYLNINNSYLNIGGSTRLEAITINLKAEPTPTSKTSGATYGYNGGSTYTTAGVATDTGYVYYSPYDWQVNLNRIKSPVVVPVANGDINTDDVDVYVAYADSTTNQIRFRRGNVSPKTVLTTDISDSSAATKYGTVAAVALFGGKSQSIEGSSLRDIFDFDKNYRLSNYFIYDFNVTQYPYLSYVANSRAANAFPYVYPYKDVDHRPYSGTYYQVMPADSLQTLSGQTIHVVASSGTDISYDDGEVADIYKKSSESHSYRNGAGDAVGLGVTSDKTAVIAWHDLNADRIKLSYMTDQEMSQAEEAIKLQQTKDITDDYVQPAAPAGMDFNTKTNGKYVGFYNYYTFVAPTYKPYKTGSTSTTETPSKTNCSNENPVEGDDNYEEYLKYVQWCDDYINVIQEYGDELKGMQPYTQDYEQAFEDSYLEEYYNALQTYKNFLVQGQNNYTAAEKEMADQTFEAARDYYLAHTDEEFNRINAAAAVYFAYYNEHLYYNNTDNDIGWRAKGFQANMNAINSSGEQTVFAKYKEAIQYLYDHKYKMCFTKYDAVGKAWTATNKLANANSNSSTAQYARYKCRNKADTADVYLTTTYNNFKNIYVIEIPNLIKQITEYYEREFNERSNISYVYTDEQGIRHHSIAFENSINRTKVWENHTKTIGSGGSKLQMVVDSDDGIHIAFYKSGDLMYAYLPSYMAQPQVYKIDTYDDVGDYVTLNVGKDEQGNQIPFIGYYGNKHAKFAKWIAGSETSGTNSYADGVKNDKYTGKWEIITVPTTAVIIEDTVNVAVWTNNDGELRNIPSSAGEVTDIVETVLSKKGDLNKTGMWNESDTDYFYNNTHTYQPGPSVRVYANGSSNPVMGYINSSGSFEMAQIK